MMLIRSGTSTVRLQYAGVELFAGTSLALVTFAPSANVTSSSDAQDRTGELPATAAAAHTGLAEPSAMAPRTRTAAVAAASSFVTPSTSCESGSVYAPTDRDRIARIWCKNRASG